MRKSLYEFCIENDQNELLQQWHPQKNESMTPKSVTFGSQRKAWWICGSGHEWQAAVYTRTGASAGCPVCMGRKVIPGENDFASKNPEAAAEWHPTKNRGLKPNEISPNAARKVWWLCEKGHEWQARVGARAAGTGCPICSRRLIITGENDLATTHPSLATQWHPSKNGALTPEKVFSGSIRKVWWQCNKGHEWRTDIASRALAGNGCPICAGKIILPGENDLATLFPEIAKEWHSTKNETLTPQQVAPFSNRKVWWTCPLGHDYMERVAQRTNNHGCPFCAGRQVLPGFNDLATLEPVISSQWHPTLNGPLTPDQVTTGSHKKVWWECPNGHVWKTVIYSRARGNKHGCPVCAGRVNPKNVYRYNDLMADK